MTLISFSPVSFLVSASFLNPYILVCYDTGIWTCHFLNSLGVCHHSMCQFKSVMGKPDVSFCHFILTKHVACTFLMGL